MSPDIPLHELAEVNPSRPRITLDLSTEVSFVPMDDVSESGRWERRQIRALRDVNRGYTYFGEGDVLFAKITPCTENGKGFHAVGVKNGVGFASTEFHVLRARDNADAGFIYQWSIYRPLRLKSAATMTGSAGQQRVPSSFLASFRVPQIAKEEQSKIAEILSTVDQAIEQTDTLIGKQQRIKTGLIQDLLTRGIDEHGNTRSEQTHEFKDSPLGRIPVEWDITEVGHCAFVTKLAGFEFMKYFDYRAGGDVIALRALNIKNERLDLAEIQRISKAVSDKLPRSRIFTDDILITYIGAYIGDVLRIEDSDRYHLAPNIAKIVAGNSLLPRFLEVLLRSSAVQRQIKNLTAVTATPSLTMTQIRKLLVAVPRDIHEQHRIALHIDGARNSLNSLSSGLKKLRSLKSGLMQDLLTGNRRVTTLLTQPGVASV